MRGRVAFLLCLGCLSAGQPRAEEGLVELPHTLPARHGVIGLRPAQIAPDTVAVELLFPQGPAERAGLLPGDRLLGVAPYRTRTASDLGRCTQSYFPGTRIELVVQRDGLMLGVPCTVTDVGHLYFLMGEEHGMPRSDSLAARWGVDRVDSVVAAADPLQARVLALIEAEGAAADLEALRHALLMESRRYGADCRLEVVQRALAQPLSRGGLTETLAREMGSGQPLYRCLARVAARLDLDVPAVAGPWTSELGASLDSLDPANPELAEHLLLPVAKADAQAQAAFHNLSAAEVRRLIGGAMPLLQRAAESGYLEKADRAEVDQHTQTLRLAKRADLAHLFAAAGILARLVEPQQLRVLRRLVSQLGPARAERPPGVRGDLLYAQTTPFGWVLVGGTGPNYYGGDAWITIDVGGDDVYLGNAGSPAPLLLGEGTSGSRPASKLVIDFDGDDRYLGGTHGSPGGVVAGVSLLLDLHGSDVYRGEDLVQGAAFCGVGVLWDQEGDDVYLAGTSAQGAGFFGAGLLLDEGGADLYVAAQRCQGFGGTRGVGLLRDGRGDDRYLAECRVPSHDGTSGVSWGWAQGVGCGFRGFGSGGLGLLVDKGGDDEYQGGEFCQGVGYFFGIGVLVDTDGDDAYRGRRYAQGAAAHQAVGLLIDSRGDDTYWAEVAASQGAGWDAAIGILEDCAGNDRYVGSELAQGAASMNGLGVLLDWDGADQYRATSGQGQGGSTEYWGGRQAPNLGVLIDAGGRGDRYDLSGRGDGRSFSSAGKGLFADR